MKDIILYDRWPGLSALPRNALRAVCLMAGFLAKFAWSDEAFRLEGEGERLVFPAGPAGPGAPCSFRFKGIPVTAWSASTIEPVQADGWVFSGFDLQASLIENTAQLDMPASANLYALYRILCASFPDAAQNRAGQTAFLTRLKSIQEMTLQKPGYDGRDDFSRLWAQAYGTWGCFFTRGDHTVNPINRSETGVYKEAFERSADGVASIDHAVKTLLAMLPGDAERILDIGSGPGYVNRHIPPDRALLAMDIDPEILKGNRCQTCVGDILDIPLEDRAVDLCMACDVLEHVEPSQLEQAMEELKRVSARYLFLQVPYRELLRTSHARCGQCGHIWHVNFHKSSFTLERLLSLPGDGWEPLSIGFSGEVSYLDGGSAQVELMERLGLNVYSVSGWRCPVCGSGSLPEQLENDRALHAVCAASPSEAVAPRYSEVAVLFCRREAVPVLRTDSVEPRNNDEGQLENTAWLRFTPDTLFSNIYTGKEIVPFALCGNCRFNWEKGGVLERLQPDGSAYVSAALPLRFTGEDTFRLCGSAKSGNKLTICLLDACGREYGLETVSLTPGDFDIELHTDYRACASRVFIKIYFERDSWVLTSIGFTDGRGMPYRQLLAGEDGHLSLQLEKMTIRWFVPNGESARFMPSPEDWMAAAEGEQKTSPSLLPDYIHSLHRIIGGQRRESEERAGQVERLKGQVADLMEQLERIHFDKAALEKQTSLLQQDQESRLKYVELEKQELRQSLEARECQLQQSQVAEQRLLQEMGQMKAVQELMQQQLATVRFELAYTKEQLALREAMALAARPPKRMRLKTKAIPALRKGCRLIVLAVHKVPYLYPLLVRLGVKRLYNRVKLKIKGGESYE